MKRIYLAFAAIFISATALAQTSITGTVFDAELGSPLPGASIVVQGTDTGTSTDFDGKFTLETSRISGVLVVSYIGFITERVAFSQAGDIGSVSLSADAEELEGVVVVGSGLIDLARERQTPIAVSSVPAAEIQLKGVGNVEFPEVMKNTPNVYVSNQAGGFGDSQIFVRGFDQTNTAVLLNGQPINSVEDGRVFWSNWQGMADVANAVQIQRGLGSSKLAISSVGGTINIVSKATGREEGGFARFLTGNDSYGKTTVSYDSGQKGKWAYSVLLDHWQGHRKWAGGTFGQGQTYFIGIGFQPNDSHNFNFLITGAPQFHGQNFSKDLEEYEEFGEKFNDNAGFLDGEQFTFRRNYYHKPVANLNWDWSISDKSQLSTVLYASWGRGGGTGPLGRQTNFFREDGQVDFDAIVANNIAENPNGLGTFGSAGLLRASINNHNWYGALTNYEFEPSENWSLNLGADIRFYRGDHWRQLVDKLGLDGYNDNFRTDRPSDYVISETFEADPWAALFSFADPDQRYDYDYSENINYQGLFGQAEYSDGTFSVFLQGAASNQDYQREGRLSGFGDGEGKSDKLSRFGYSVKTGASYTFSDNHQVFANVGQYSRQAFLDNIFANIRYSNEIVEPEVDNEEITGLEGGYRFRNGDWAVNFNVYYTKWGNRFLQDFGQQDIGGTEIDVRTRYTDITQVHRGAELDLRYRPSAALLFKWYGSVGNWEYDGTTPFIIENDETGALISRGTVDLTGTKIGNAPQVSTGAGTRFNACENLSFDADINIFTEFYGFVDVEDVIASSLAGSVFQSERLPAYTLVDAGATYTFNLGNNEMVLRGNVYNVFDADYINQRDSFGYYLGVGRTWNLSLRYNF
ncbi:TonB-dependent receptor [Flagellimonas meishanensis]|uniref:TonB-dependent receptor n=1 Tax=Flagellimonas meishanensis TaxID=2873264 RepID=UPI001CA6B3D7|nr:TonB-dependent receptor [[Muricauda] meishanensis]